MKREEFRELVSTLTEREIYYRDNPSTIADSNETIYKNFEHDENGVLTFPFFHPDNKSFVERDKLIPLYNNKFFQSTLVALNKQTRFSIVPLHRHDYIEMFYVYTGKCSSVINGQQFDFEQGDVCIMDSGAIHKILPTGENDIVLNCAMRREYFNVQFIEGLIDGGPILKFLGDAISKDRNHNQYLLFHTTYSYVFKDLIEQLFCECYSPSLSQTRVVDNYLNLIFIELARCYQGSRENEYRNARKYYPTEILRYMEEHCTTCTLNEVADKFGYHPNYLSRMIHEATGVSFKELITDYRLSRAEFLLASSADPISQVARECGYSNQYFFYNKFHEKYGCTPAEYRENRQ